MTPGPALVGSVNGPVLTAGADITFTDRGVRDLKGIPEAWQLYAVS